MRGSAIAAVVGVLTVAMIGSVAAASGSKSVRVPRVVGQPESRAQCALAKAGLRWRYRADSRVRGRPVIPCSGHGAVIPDPTVISQSPRGGSLVRSHSVVVLDDECLRGVRHHALPCA